MLTMQKDWERVNKFYDSIPSINVTFNCNPHSRLKYHIKSLAIWFYELKCKFMWKRTITYCIISSNIGREYALNRNDWPNWWAIVYVSVLYLLWYLYSRPLCRFSKHWYLLVHHFSLIMTWRYKTELMLIFICWVYRGDELL